MKTLFLCLVTLLISSATATAHEAFTLVSTEKKQVSRKEISQLESKQTVGKKNGSVLTFAEKEITLVATTGPLDDMLSYRILGVRNPTFVVPAGATLTILFANTDTDMRHDVRFGHVKDEFLDTPDTSLTAGSNRLAGMGDGEIAQAERIVLKATGNGMFKYFCSIRGHAKGGMWGHIAVGVAPDSKAVPPEKKPHIHHPDEDKMPAEQKTENRHEHKPTPTASPTPNKPAGHDHGDHKQTPTPTPSTPSDSHNHKPQGRENSSSQSSISSTVDINDPMNREGSGTSWLPDSSPMNAYTRMYSDGGMLMLMGTAFVRFVDAGSRRDLSAAGFGSRSRFDAPNMFMAMYSRPLSDRSQLGLRVMASLDPITQRGYGYPLLYQSGELFRGEPIHDRQHPHDLFSELAGSFSYKTYRNQSFSIYAGVVGEPALGPSMFMHRPSGANNPNAPISHHWQDASHISWGVVTAGYNFGRIKIEASAFNGTEPDADRWRPDPIRLNSFSARIAVNPTKDLAIQISHGFLKKPERAEPDLDHLRRTTASVIYNKKLGDDRNFAFTSVWGNNYKEGHGTNSILFESDYSFQKNAVFGRIEYVQKDGHELVLPHDDPIHEDTFLVGSYSIGYVRDFVKDKGIDVGLGGMLTLGTNPSELSHIYGGTSHGGWQLFIRFRPSRMKH